MNDTGMAIKAGEPERLSGHEHWETWRSSLNVEPEVEWRRRFLRIAYAEGPFADSKIPVEKRSAVSSSRSSTAVSFSPRDSSPTAVSWISGGLQALRSRSRDGRMTRPDSTESQP